MCCFSVCGLAIVGRDEVPKSILWVCGEWNLGKAEMMHTSGATVQPEHIQNLEELLRRLLLLQLLNICRPVPISSVLVAVPEMDAYLSVFGRGS